MARNRSLLLLLLILLNSLALGMAQSAASRLKGDWRSSARVTLSAARLPVMAAATLGVPAADLRLERMILLLEPSSAQQQALAAQLDALYTPSSPEYHHWLTPVAFADAFANSASDASAVAAWLTSQGFTVAPLPASRGWIEFSGSARQVEQAFAAPLALAATPSGSRAVLTAAISVPAALAPLVHGLVSLDGVVAAPAIVSPRALSISATDLAAQSSPAQAAALTPRLLAAQGALASTRTGAGQTIAIAARANPSAADLAAFRAAFGLPATDLIALGESIATPAAADHSAVTLMASWAGAAAPQAQLAVAANASTAATDGLDLSLAALVDRAQIQSLVVGYSACEAALSEPHQAFYAALYRQAAAQGITVAAATGDSGPAACFKAGSDGPVTTGFAVNALASTPWNAAVGAAAASTDAAFAAWTPINPADPAYASGGGASSLYSTPGWQAGRTSSSFRTLPDLTLPVALDSASSRGIVLCLGSEGACNPQRSGGSAAAAALFAGMSALAAEAAGAPGNLAPRLYAVSASAFEDVQKGSAQLPCTAASAGCDAAGKIGFAAAPGYDQATGLGVANAPALITELIRPVAAATGTATVSNLQVTPNTLNPTAALSLTADVSTTGTIDAADRVWFKDATTGAWLASNLPLGTSGGTYGSVTTVYSSGFTQKGYHTIQACYPDSACAVSRVTTVNVIQGSTKLALNTSSSSPYAGATFSATATVSEDQYAGTVNPTGTVNFVLNGTTYIGTVNATTGVAYFQFSAPASGSQTLSANYSGDFNYAGSAASNATLNVQTNTGPTLAFTSAVTGAAGASVTVPVQVKTTAEAATSAAIYPSGTLTVSIDGTAQSPQTLALTAATSTVNLSVTMPATSGSHSIKLDYSGDSYYAASTANSTFTVSKVTPTVVASWPASPVAGNPILVSATVTGSNSTVPTGTVTFNVDGTPQTATTLAAASANSATATLAVSGLSATAHTLTATYGGDTYYLTASSPSVSVTPSLGPTVTTLTADPVIMSKTTTETFTAVVAPVTTASGVTYALTGTVKFYDGTKLIGTVAVASNKAILSGLPLALNASHSITAVYSGDSTWATSTSSAVLLEAIAPPVTVVLTSNLINVPAGRALVLTATVTPATSTTATANPTGNVVFYEGTTSLGQAALVPVPNSNASIATLTLLTVSGGVWTGGNHTVFAYYVGDTNYDAATSNSLTLTVQDFTITLNPTSPPTNIDIPKGGSASVSFNVKSWGGFNGQVQVICTPPATTLMTCTATPQQLYPTADVTFLVKTFSTGTLTAQNTPPLWPRAVGGTALAALAFFLIPFGRRIRIFQHRAARRFLTLLLLLAGLATAGIGCNKVTTINAQGTGLGAYILKATVTAYVDTTVVNRSTSFTVNVY